MKDLRPETNLKVSVRISTYNHERFIRQAVESALAQDADFDYEIVIGEDCSSDSTRSILLDLQKQRPDRIRLLLAERNQGMRHNFLKTLKACRGQYTALLDGDDYWVDSSKLQKQVTFLDSHPECSLCFHNAKKLYEGGRETVVHKKKLATIHTLSDLLRWQPIQTCTAMFRSHLFQGFPKSFDSFSFGDWPLYVMVAQHGDIGYLHEVMAVYRQHPGGVWSCSGKPSPSGRIRHCEDQICFFEAINEYLNFEYDELAREAIESRRATIRRLSQWMNDLQATTRELTELIAPGETLILADRGRWEGHVIAERRIVHLTERDGEYSKDPPDDDTALRELESKRSLGANFMVIGEPAFWWLDHYPMFAHRLRSSFRCVLQNDRVIVFDLRA